MINSINFKNYRCFQDFSLNDLSRVNLLVGMNNSGKSSVLEGLYFLQSGNWSFLNNVLSRRGWLRHNANQLNPNQWFQYLNFKDSLFNTHAIKAGEEFFSIQANSAHEFTKVEMKFIKPGTEVDNKMQANELVLYNILGQLGLSMIGQVGLKAEFSNNNRSPATTPIIPLFEGSEVRLETLNYLPNIFVDRSIIPKTHYIFPESVDSASAMLGWSQIAFQNNVVNKIIDILKLTKKDISGIQPLQLSQAMPSSFYLKLTDLDTPLPIGSLGDGVRRILYLLLSFPFAKGGFVFIDEIETGIHYSIMKDMWGMVLEFAKDFDVQIFATTHSLDCIRGLARVCNEFQTDQDVSIHRIDNTKKESINYTQAEIINVAKMDEEIRGG